MLRSLKLNKAIVRSLAMKGNKVSTASLHMESGPPKDLNTDEGKPFDKIPTVSQFSLLRGFLPGGKFDGMNQDEFHRWIKETYGDVIKFTGMFGRRDLVITFNPADFEKIYRNEGIWPYRDGLDTLAYHRKVKRADFFGNYIGLVSDQNEPWSRFRSAVNPVMMNPKAVLDYIQPIDKVAKEFLEVIKEKRDVNTKEMDENFKSDLNNWALESIALVALDTRLQCFDEKLKNPDTNILINGMISFFELSYKLDIKPSIWKYFPYTPNFNKLMRALDDVTDVAIKYIDKASERMEKQAPKAPEEMSVLEKLIKIDRKIAIVMGMDLLCAGIDTTSAAVIGLLLCLAKNQDKQEFLRQEALKIQNKNLSAKDLNNLPYLRACIKESIRLYPVISNNVRAAANDLVIGGYKIPKGVVFVMPVNVLMHDEKYFKNAKDFIPERWIKGHELYKGNSDPFVYLPFGFGPRSCIGKRLSTMEVEVLLINLLRNFKIEFDYPIDRAFKSNTVNTAIIPLKFKFTDL